MTRDEFLAAYYDYAVPTKEEAVAEAQRVCVEGDGVVAVRMGELGYCLMLESAFLCVQGSVDAEVVKGVEE